MCEDEDSCGVAYSSKVPNNDIAQKVGLRRESVSKWRTRFLQGGLSGLYDEQRPGRPWQIEEERVARLVAKDAGEHAAGPDAVELGIQPHR